MGRSPESKLDLMAPLERVKSEREAASPLFNLNFPLNPVISHKMMLSDHVMMTVCVRDTPIMTSGTSWHNHLSARLNTSNYRLLPKR